MSASLVGSEMCIRDRPHRGGSIPPDTPDWRLRRKRPHRGGLPPPRTTPRPVSYTHLTLPTICSV
eukprot:12224952-Alexandrium_andersonii.AAC.1